MRERTRISIRSSTAPKARPKAKLATTWVTSNASAEPSTRPKPASVWEPVPVQV